LHLTCSARFVSSIGDGLVLIAFPLLATQLTHNPILIAGVAFATQAPWIVVALPAGALADRVGRRRLMTTVELARAGVLFLLAVAILSHHVSLVQLYVCAVLVSSLETAFDSASMAVVPQLVADKDLEHANSRMVIAQMSGEQFIGTALGGLLFAAAASLPALLDGVSFAASAALLLLALTPARRLGRHGTPRDGFSLAEPVGRSERPALIHDIKSGLTWLMHEPRLRLVAGLIAGFAFCQGLGLGIIVIYCTRVLHLSGAGFGLFTAAAASGNVAGAWAAPRVHSWLGTGRTLLGAGFVGGLALLTVGATSSTGVALVALIAEAIAVGIGNVASVALRHRLIPLELAGRVSAAMRASIVGAGAIAALIGGALVTLLGPHAPFAIGGVAQIVAAIVIGGALVRRLIADHQQVIDLREAVDLTEAPAAAEA
jgi:MFS family permease